MNKTPDRMTSSGFSLDFHAGFPDAARHGSPFGLTFLMNSHCIKYLVVCLAVALFHSRASGSELKSDELNYGAILPDGWTVVFQSMTGFSIASPDKMKSITLLVSKADFSRINADAISEIEQGLLQAGSERLSSRHFTVDGVPAFETVHRVGKPPFASSFVSHLIIAGDRIYTLHGTHIGGDVVQAADLQKALSSFHFLQPPSSPAPSGIRGNSVLWVVGVILCIGVLFWLFRRRSA